MYLRSETEQKADEKEQEDNDVKRHGNQSYSHMFGRE